MFASMRAFIKFSFPVIILTCWFCIAGAQETKKEFEQYISRDEFPQSIVNALRPILKNSRRTKYIEEFDDSLHTYEIKTLWNDHWLSIEFFEDHSLMDVEVIFEFEDLEKEAQTNIEYYLTNSFKRYKITRIQKQYSPVSRDITTEILISRFQENDLEHFQKRIEIVARVISNNRKTIGSFEFLFDEHGDLIKWRREKKMLTDNVLY
jgi:hypothetical protein